MNEFTKVAILELDKIRVDGKKIKTGEVRKVSAKVYKSLKDRSFEEILDICEDMLEQRTWDLEVIAYDIAFRERNNYTMDTFERFENWLINYVRGWGDCDDFCTHAFGALLLKYNELYDKVLAWCERPEFWMRRAAAVIMIYSIKKSKDQCLSPFEISDALMNDEHDLVLKGYGWMLKVYGRYNEDKLMEYLSDNVSNIPRISFRYAIENLDIDKRRDLMKL